MGRTATMRFFIQFESFFRRGTHIYHDLNLYCSIRLADWRTREHIEVGIALSVFPLGPAVMAQWSSPRKERARRQPAPIRQYSCYCAIGFAAWRRSS